VAAIAPTLSTAGTEKLAADRERHGDLIARAREVDEETEEAARRRCAADAHGATLEATEKVALREQEAAAQLLLDGAAGSGGLEGIMRLEQSLPGSFSDLAGALSRIRGDVADWPAVIAELIRKEGNDTREI
jgi:hypothetical protein